MATLDVLMRPFEEIFFVCGHNAYLAKTTSNRFSKFVHKFASHSVKFALLFLIPLNLIIIMVRHLEILEDKTTSDTLLSMLTGMVLLFHSLNAVVHLVFIFYKNELYALFTTFRHHTVHVADAVIISKQTKIIVFVYHFLWIYKTLHYLFAFGVVIPMIIKCKDQLNGQDDLFGKKFAYNVSLLIVGILPEFSIAVIGFPYIIMLWARLTLVRAKKGLREEKCTLHARQNIVHFCIVYLEILQLLKAFNRIISPCLHALLIFGILAITYTVSSIQGFGIKENLKLIFLATPLTVMLIKILSSVFRFNKEVRNYFKYIHV